LRYKFVNALFVAKFQVLSNLCPDWFLCPGSLNYTRECAEEEAEKANRKLAELNNLVRDLESERRELEVALIAT
jgi:hypothetical protein